MAIYMPLISNKVSHFTEMETDDIIRLYFDLGISYREILACLAHLHGHVISLRTLKRTLRRLRLFRRKPHNDIVEVALFLLSESQKSGQLLGYRMMHLKCVQKGFVVSQDVIRNLLHLVDPEGVAARGRNRLKRRAYFNKGLNFLWHIDGYDKLKPYGICISGSIDGFSRYILWLEAHSTNNDPKLIAGYFMDTVKSLGGCPARIRADKGTENSRIKQMQLFLRSYGADQWANKPYIEGSSNHNQRIDQWWVFLRKEMAQYWMDLLKMLTDMGCFTGSFIDKSLIQFCFMNLIQTELNEISPLWNHHRIRPSRTRPIPAGRPSIMYNCGNLYSAHDYLQLVPIEQIDVCKSETVGKGPFPCDEAVYQLAMFLVEEDARQMPQSGEDAVVLYQFLRRQILDGI